MSVAACSSQPTSPHPSLPPVVCLLELGQTIIQLGAADLGRFISCAGLTPGMRLVSGPLLQALNRWGLVLQALSLVEPWQGASTNAAYLTVPLHGPTASWVRPCSCTEKMAMIERSETQFSLSNNYMGVSDWLLSRRFRVANKSVIEINYLIDLFCRSALKLQ